MPPNDDQNKSLTQSKILFLISFKQPDGHLKPWYDIEPMKQLMGMEGGFYAERIDRMNELID